MEHDADGYRIVDVETYDGFWWITSGMLMRLCRSTRRGGSNLSVSRQASAMRRRCETPRRFQAMALGEGTALRLPDAVSEVVGSLTAHMHVQGGGIRSLRFLRQAEGNLWEDGKQQVERIRCAQQRGERSTGGRDPLRRSDWSGSTADTAVGTDSR